MKLNLIISSQNKQLQKRVERLIKNSEILNRLLSKIFLLCQISNFNDPTKINLIYKKTNQEIFAWFSWTPQDSFITIEFNKLNKIDDQFIILVLAHELFHLILRKNKNLVRTIIKYSKLHTSCLQQIKETRLLPKIILEELIISSFIPEGYLSKKYFNKSIKKISKFLYNDLIDWRRYIAYKMQFYAKTYLKNKQTIDNNYIEKIIKLIEEK